MSEIGSWPIEPGSNWERSFQQSERLLSCLAQVSPAPGKHTTLAPEEDSEGKAAYAVNLNCKSNVFQAAISDYMSTNK